MSLGWNTESALLPSKAKKIEVNSRSMMDLKAIVSEKEEHSKLNQLMRETDGKNFRKHRGAFSISGKLNDKDDIFFSKKANRGVEDRNSKDLKEKEEIKISKHNQTNLDKKVLLYNKIKSGEIKSEDAKKAGFLVDFKPDHIESDIRASNSYIPSSHQDKDDGGDKDGGGGNDGKDDDDNEVDIEDEFGRSFTVSKFSKEYKEYKIRLLNEQNESIRLQLEEERQYKIHQSYESNKRLKRDDDHDTDDVISSGVQQWPVSSGRDRKDCGEWDESLQKSDLKDKGINSLLSDHQSSKDLHDGMGGVNGRVKSKWDFTLSDKEKTYLRDITIETSISRAKVQPLTQETSLSNDADATSTTGGRRDVKAERRELLRKKKEARTNR